MEERPRKRNDEAARRGRRAEHRVEDCEGERAVLWVRKSAHAESEHGQAESGAEGQSRAIKKMSGMLGPGGVVIFSAGGVEDADERVNPCMDQDLFYAALGESKLLRLLSDCHLRLRHFELDQYPEEHLVLIAQNRE